MCDSELGRAGSSLHRGEEKAIQIHREVWRSLGMMFALSQQRVQASAQHNSHGRLCQAGNIHKPRFLQSQQLFHHRDQAHLQACNN